MTNELLQQTIYTTWLSSPAGMLRLRSTENFISEINFCDEVQTSADFTSHGNLPPVMRQCIQELNEYFDGKRKTFTVPIQQPGTAFQQAVWKQLLEIPFGTTISYLHLSRQLGNVKAIRAVAASNGRNKIAVIVPCHRVIGSNKDMVGYAGGISRKKWLLQHELNFTVPTQTLF